MFKKAGFSSALLLLVATQVQLFAAYDGLRGVRSQLVFLGTALLAGALLALPDPVASLRRVVRLPPAIPLLLSLLWVAILAGFAPFPDFARAEVLRLLAGALAFVVAASLPEGEKAISPRALLGGVIAIGCVQTLCDFALLGARGGVSAGFIYSAFGTHEELGSLLLMLVPFALVLAIIPSSRRTDTPDIPRLLGFAATLLLSMALLIARCRSAWLGASIGLLVAGLLLRTRLRPAQVATGVAALLLLSGIVLAATGGSSTLLKRAATFAHATDAIGGRWAMWRGAAEMARTRPITGWGPGSYVVLQKRWTGLGRSPEETRRFGANHFNIAHNYYVQQAADTGLVGLALHLATILTAFLAFVRGQRDATSAQSRALLLAGAVMVAGTAVDAIASPSYNFHGITTLWCVLLGSASSPLSHRSEVIGKGRTG